jgi:uncharacterized protein (DUF1501 family)
MHTAALKKRELSRRSFLRTGAAAAGIVGWSFAGADTPAAADTPAREINGIFLFLTGGPSQLDTWDPKPDAPAEVRGPFASIATSVPGIRIGEHFPRMAGLAHRFAIVRSVHHQSAAIHETGQQLLQTGRLSRGEPSHPHIGAVLSARHGPRRPGVPPFVMLPGSIGDTGMRVYNGQGAGFLGDAHRPVILERSPSAFGEQCLEARRLIESGVRCVVVNMFDTVFDRVTWDCHADRRCLRSTLDDYRQTLCPTFDRAYSALIEDLHDRGLLNTTLVVAAGEFGRTPRLNSGGGRDHWPGVWSVLFAGGGVRGGQVIGASDKYGAEPVRRAVRAEDIAATVYRACGIDHDTHLIGPHGEQIPLTDGRPIDELFG